MPGWRSTPGKGRIATGKTELAILCPLCAFPLSLIMVIYQRAVEMDPEDSRISGLSEDRASKSHS